MCPGRLLSRPHQIDIAICQIEVDGHIRELGQESIEDGNDVAPARLAWGVLKSDRPRYFIHAEPNESFQFIGFGQQASRAVNQQWRPV